MKLALISPPHTVDRETQIVAKLFEAGLRHFHLRKPGATSFEIERYLGHFQTSERKLIVLHSSHELVDEWNLGVQYALPLHF